MAIITCALMALGFVLVLLFRVALWVFSLGVTLWIVNRVCEALFGITLVVFT